MFVLGCQNVFPLVLAPQHKLEQTTIFLGINDHFLQPKTHPTIPRVLLKSSGVLEWTMFFT